MCLNVSASASPKLGRIAKIVRRGGELEKTSWVISATSSGETEVEVFFKASSKIFKHIYNYTNYLTNILIICTLSLTSASVCLLSGHLVLTQDFPYLESPRQDHT